ncbi:hypothetical protein BKA65DRAFT_292349 [Rhexocercosporidium sp. MPI-PUGE-AT-0058]|nr:hypothetical protein BKA65DRAFT_292349 [Rhexocercosporidium sp. MPI-PUGE-AT-0058]
MESSITSATPIEQFNTLLSTSEFLFVVVYRGHWCPFCRSYLSTLSTLSPSILSSSGKPLMITSEPSSFLPETRKLTGYQGDAIIDTSNELVGYLRENFGLEVAVSEKKGYVNGMAQPAVLVVKRDGGEVLEKWAIVPGIMNLGGAKDRPELTQVWENVQAKLKGGKAVHGTYKKISAVGVLKGTLFG